MKREVIISARQTGKTSWLIDQFENDTETECPIFVTHNTLRADDIVRQARHYHKGYILSIESVLSFHYLNNTIHRLYLDEFLFFTKEQKKKLFNIIKDRGISFTAISTANRCYNEKLLAECEFWWEHHQTYPDIFLTEEDMVVKYGEDYVYNLALLPNTSVECRANRLKKLLSPDDYKTEVIGLFLDN